MYITIIAMTTAATITSMSSAMPMAVMMESIGEHQIDDDQLHDDPEESDCAGAAPGSLSCGSISPWISCVALAIRNSAAADQDDVAPGDADAEHRERAALRRRHQRRSA